MTVVKGDPQSIYLWCTFCSPSTHQVQSSLSCFYPLDVYCQSGAYILMFKLSQY